MNRLLVLCILGLIGSSTFGSLPALGTVPVFHHSWGSLGSGPGQFDTPRGIAVDPDGNLYVADTGNDRIQKFAPNGAFLREWGEYGSGPGQFDTPWDVDVDDSCHVYVADTYNSRVQKFTCDGAFVAEWGSIGDGDGQFGQLRGIAVDDSFHVFVSDQYISHQRVQKFDSSGTFLLKWGTAGSGNGQFNAPRELAVDQNHFVYVVDSVPNDRLQKFTSMGAYVTQWGGFTALRGVAIGLPDTVYTTDETNRVLKFSSTGTPLDSWGGGTLNQPHGVAVYGDWVYVVDKGNDRIVAFVYSDVVGLPEDDAGFLPGPLRVYPNPSSSIVNVSLPLAATPDAPATEFTVQARVFDLSGRLVRVIQDGFLSAGEHRFQWDGTDREGSPTGPGIYYLQVVVNGTAVRTTKVVRVR